MDKIPKQHLDFLEFVTKKIYGEESGWWSLDLLAEEYNKKYSINLKNDVVRHIAALYKNKYFTTSSKSDLKIFPTPEIKQEIENHGSLSKYLQSLTHENKKATNRQNWTIISPIIINVLMLIVAIIFGVFSVKLNNKANKLEKELEKNKKELNKKDSIIFELNKQLIINDTINKAISITKAHMQ